MDISDDAALSAFKQKDGEGAMMNRNLDEQKIMRMAGPFEGTRRDVEPVDLLEIANFLEDLAAEGAVAFDLGAPDPYHRMTIHLIKQHLDGKSVTATSLAAASGLPYATAKRRIAEMLDGGMIEQRPRTKTGKTFSLHPSDMLIHDWTAYAGRVRRLGEQLFGRKTANVGRDYFFGGSYIESKCIEPPAALSEPLRLSGGLRFLIHGDPTFMAMNAVKRQFEQVLGCEIQQRAFSIDRLQEEALKNAERKTSRYDIIAANLPWVGEFASRGALRPLDDLLDFDEIDVADFHPAGWRGSHYQGQLYGIPLQTTPEVLFYRKDLLAEAGLSPPRTTDELVRVAKAMHDPIRRRYGIAWNAARGTPLGHSFLFACAAFGRPILNIPAIAGGFDAEALSEDAMRPTIDVPHARDAAEFLRGLLDVSPPGILSMAWYERIRSYGSGEAAMAYSYTQHAPFFDLDPSSPAHGQTGYLPQPAGPDGAPIAPVGGYALGIPANLPEDRVEAAAKAITVFASPQAQKLYIQNGSRTTPRYSVGADPDVKRLSDVFDVIDGMAWRDELQFWPRPPSPFITGITRICGEELHDMLRGVKTVAAALSDAQDRADALMRDAADNSKGGLTHG
jgi:multiple sugar transport system substrate-binding protein